MANPPGHRARKKAATAAAITAAAGELLDAGCGPDRFTMADVADAAGVSHRTAFRYFATKHDVLLAACEVDPLLPDPMGLGLNDDRRMVDLGRLQTVLAVEPTFLGSMINRLAGSCVDVDFAHLRRACDCAQELVAAARAHR